MWDQTGGFSILKLSLVMTTRGLVVKNLIAAET